jgi:hypothetical protein
VRSQPTTTDQTPDLAPDVSQWIDQAFYRTLFAGSVGNGTFLLPGGTTIDALLRVNISDVRRTDDGAVHQVCGKGKADWRVPVETRIHGYFSRQAG